MHCEDLIVGMTQQGAKGNEWEKRCEETVRELRAMERECQKAEEKIEELQQEMADGVKESEEKQTMTDIGAAFFDKPKMTNQDQQMSQRSIADSQKSGGR